MPHDSDKYTELLTAAARIDKRATVESALLHSFLKSQKAGIVLVDADGKLIDTSRFGVQISHPGMKHIGKDLPCVEWEPILGKVFDSNGDYLPPEQWPIALAIKGTASSAMVSTLVDGERLFHECDARPLFDESGSQVGAVVYFRVIEQ